MEKIKCKCGCGVEIDKFNKYGKERFYVNGHHRRGIKMSDEWRLKRSELAKERGFLPPWIKSRKNKTYRKDAKWKIWSENVMKKNNGLCIMCGNKANQSHHIKDFFKYPKLRYEIENGIPLCRACHLKIHNPLQYRWGKPKDKNLMYNE